MSSPDIKATASIELISRDSLTTPELVSMLLKVEQYLNDEVARQIYINLGIGFRIHIGTT